MMKTSIEWVRKVGPTGGKKNSKGVYFVKNVLYTALLWGGRWENVCVCVCVVGGGGGNLGTTYLIPSALYCYSPVKHKIKIKKDFFLK